MRIVGGLRPLAKQSGTPTQYAPTPVVREKGLKLSATKGSVRSKGVARFMRRVAGLALVTAVVVSACGGIATVEAEIAGETWTMFVQTGQSGDNRMAGIEGTVEFDAASGCVMVRLSENLGGSLATVVWPDGTRLATEGFGVTLPDGVVIGDGGTVLGGGASEPHPDLKKQCPDAFPTDSALFVMDSVQADR